MNKKSRPPRWDWLASALRGWWKFYFGTVIVAVILALLTQGPSQSLAFLVYAQTAPLIFWPTLVALTGSALAGLIIDFTAWREQRRDPHHRRKKYLAAVAKEYRYIPLVIDVDEVKRLPEFVYQPLRWYEDISHTSTDQTAAQTVRAAITDIDEALEQRGQRALVILGWPGSGKTTLLRHHLFERANTIGDDASAVLPVYISLPLFAPLVGAADGIKTYLIKYEPALTDETVYAKHVQDAVHAGNAYLYLDGLDEVGGHDRQRVLDWIRERQQTLALHGALIVGTRYTDYQRTDFLAQADLPQPQGGYATFTELVAQPMDPPIRAKLAHGLFHALAEQLKKPAPSDEDVQAFLRLIESEPKRAEWAANPLLFSLAAYLYVSASTGQDVELPTSRVTLYHQFIQTLLAKVVRKRQDEGTGVGRESGVLYEMMRVLAEVAVRLYDLTTAPGDTGSEQARVFTEAQLNRAVDRTRNALRLSYEIGKMSEWIVASGTLSVIRPQTFAFRHPTYREYLATLGHVLRLVSGSEQLADVGALRSKSEWAEPMRMLAGVLVADESPEGNALAKTWLEALFTAACQEVPDDQNEQLDALETLIASLYEIPDVAAFARTEQVVVEAILLAWVEALLRYAQQNDRAPLERLQRLSPGVATLPAALTQPALTRLEASLALDSAPEQQRAGAKALAGMGSVVTDLAPLLRLLRNGRDESARIEAAHTLASLERADQTHPGFDALKEILSGPDTSLAALVAQGLTGVDHPDAISLMLMAVESTRDPQLRRLGALALGSIGARVRGALIRLSYDADPEVAKAALDALAKLGEDRNQLASAIAQQARQGADVSSVLQALLPYTLRQLGFTAHRIGGVEVVVPPVCDVPAGLFLMGSDKRRDPQAEANEQPQRTIRLVFFQIARYPVTVAEYACYVRATRKEPSDWQNQLVRLDHPVVNISWFDAVTYVDWLARTTSQPWRLPSEAEWEKAARGTDGRIYPWGDRWDKTRANTNDGGPRTTTPVSSYPGGASLYGAQDMAGNVWEWCSSFYRDQYGAASEDDVRIRNGTESLVLHGGSWGYDPGVARAAFRLRGDPDFRRNDRGIRVVRGVEAGAS